MELGEVIKKKRESARLTIEDLSEKSSIPVKIIEKIEEDPEYIKTPYGKLQAKAIMKFLNIDYDIKINNTDTEVYKPSEKRYSNILIKSVKLIPHIAILVIFPYIYMQPLKTVRQSQKFH